MKGHPVTPVLLRRMIPAVAVALFVVSCSATIGVSPTTPTDEGIGASTVPPEPQDRDTTDDPGATTTTVPQVAFTPTPPTLDAPPYEEVTITTDDDIDLYARYWPGGDVAVLYLHQPKTAVTGPVDSSTTDPWSFGLVDAGYTVLTPDLRGHGQSEGEPFANDSKRDIVAAYEFLRAEGHDTIVALTIQAAGPILTNVDATHDEIEFAGIGLLFTPLSRNGNDLVADLPNIHRPVWLVHIDVRSNGGIPNRLSPYVNDLYDAYVFPRVPSGQQFIDVFGDDYMGRILAFVEAASRP